MTTFTLDQLKAQVDDAQETHIANGIFVDLLTEQLTKAIDEQVKSRRIYLALSKQYVAAIDAAQRAEVAQ